MSIEEIKSQVEGLGTAWEQFKVTNDARLKEIEKKGSEDPLHKEQLDKINQFMDETKARMDQMHTALSRPAAGGVEQKNAKDIEYKEAFSQYVRKGIVSPILAPDHHMEGKSLSVQSDPDGGYLVSPAMSSRINTVIFETSPIRQLATVETISTDSLDIMDDVNEATAGWTSETGTVSETNTPQIGKRNIPVHELYAQPKATQKVIDDAERDVEAWLSGKIAEIFARKQNTAFVSGTGAGQPRGILTYTAGTSWGQIQQVNSGTSGVVTGDGLIALFYALKEDYSRNATFLMNRTVVQAVRQIKETTNQYIWQPGLQAGQPATLLGVPVMMASDMPTAAADSLSVAVGDFKRAYTVVDRIGMRTLRDPFTDKPFVKFYTTTRVGGDVTNFEAIKLLKLAA
jgi:HK97 family phage major capsid protein